MRTLRTAGVAPADVEERLVDWLGRDGEVARLDHPGRRRGVGAPARARRHAARPRPRALGDGRGRASRDALGDDCYGRDGDTLEEVVGRLLLARGLTLAVAESCTGGLVGHRLTSVSGLVGVLRARRRRVLEPREGRSCSACPRRSCARTAPSAPPCAEAMARGICERSGAPCGLSITGIAGPDGGTPTKPVGTVFIGLAVEGAVEARRFRFAGDRASVKWQSAQMALDMLRRSLGGARP